MINDYIIHLPLTNECHILEPASIEQKNDSEVDNVEVFEFDDNSLEILSEAKCGVYWREDLKSDPNYEVDQQDSEEVLNLLAEYGIPLILVK